MRKLGCMKREPHRHSATLLTSAGASLAPRLGIVTIFVTLAEVSERSTPYLGKFAARLLPQIARHLEEYTCPSCARRLLMSIRGAWPYPFACGRSLAITFSQSGPFRPPICFTMQALWKRFALVSCSWAEEEQPHSHGM